MVRTTLRQLPEELRRRRVVRMAAVYAAISWGVLVAAPDLASLLLLPAYTPRLILVLLLAGFPFALAGVWFTSPRAATPDLAFSASRPLDCSIAVLPFTNLSPDPANECFADGLTEEIIADLSQVQSLRVISRTSVMQFKGTTRDLRSIGRDLNVRHILEGSVRRAGDSLRVTAQLIDAATDTHLWAEKYSGNAGDVFEIQESVSRAIIAALRIRLSPEEDRRVAVHPIRDLRAYECYLQARQDNWRSTRASLTRALQLTRNALALVGENASLYAMMAQSHFQFVNMAIDPDPAHLERAAEYAERALMIDPRCAGAHVAKGEIAWKRGDMRQAVAELNLALELEPNSLEALLVLAYVYAFCGRSAAARPLMERLLAIDPLTPLNYGVAGLIEFFDGHMKDAVPLARRGYELEPDGVVGRWIYTVVTGWSGCIGQSPWNAQWARTERVATALEAVCQFLNLALLGDPDADRVLREEFRAGARWDEQLSWHVGSCYARLGRTEAALEWLANAHARGFWNYPFLADHDPFLQELRRDPRFGALLERIRSDWETLRPLHTPSGGGSAVCVQSMS